MQDLLACARKPAGVLAMIGLLVIGLPVTHGAGGSAGNYLIVVGEGLADSAPLADLVAARTARGLNVQVYPVMGGTTAQAIRTYIQSLWGTPNAPDYVLLVGDVDTIPCWTGLGSRLSPTDLYYVCMDGGDDWYPDIAIGRFPVQTVAQLGAMVAKTLHVEAGQFADPDYATRALMLACDDPNAFAPETHDEVIETYIEPAGMTATRVYPPYAPPSYTGTPEVAAGLNAGALLVSYFGHSTTLSWWGPAFTRPDISALYNEGMYPIVLSLSCDTARITASGEVLGETWVRQANKGAAAYVATTGMVVTAYSVQDWAPVRAMDHYFFEAIFADGIQEVGPAMHAMLFKLLDEFGAGHSAMRDFFEMFIVLGDPALRIPLRGFDLHVDSLSASVCVPPADTAEFVIDVAAISGFAEVVTLSASGYPAGCTVGFSVNSVVPPFTSVMTIGNLGPHSPGDYTIQLQGAATGGMTRAVMLELNLSNTTPGTVTLSSPPDDAVDVSSTPTLVWQPAVQAAAYEVKVATDPGFSQVVYSAVAPTNEHPVSAHLTPGTNHYWRVRALNGCGEGPWSATFSFETLMPGNYFTEQFTEASPFDLSYRTLHLVPDGSDDYYDAYIELASAFPTNPSSGIYFYQLYPGEDGSEAILTDDFVDLYGVSDWSLYVNANGNITLGGPDSTKYPTLDVHFALPRIAPLFTNLSPQLGTVTASHFMDRIVVTYQNVPEYGTSKYNNFQVEMFYGTGAITITWLACATEQCLVGVSAGLGVPTDFAETDISRLMAWSIGDVNCDGLINTFDIDPFVLALTNPAGHAAAFPHCDYMLADINCDGFVNTFDIDPFVQCLTGGCPPCP